MKPITEIIAEIRTLCDSHEKAAARIEELEAHNAKWEGVFAKRAAQEGDMIAEAVVEAEKRIEELEKEVAELREAHDVVSKARLSLYKTVSAIERDRNDKADALKQCVFSLTAVCAAVHGISRNEPWDAETLNQMVRWCEEALAPSSAALQQ